ncbi:uncharacterized protein DUF4007 [Nitrosomonas nitrosa]|jgi:hypothetical protein|uniref:DUF4007 family protein n=1 Tax=Nitrosomonas nitrosa TaxID=52442 RepID=UPI000D31E4A6|nr:DUF4007 family protein [Nitrosomonas nitrosa]PTQ92474.1 uncharacterized protein DUF4007 [Nitrosomonas nitrosa]
MKPLNKVSVSFGRHETFALRFGWLTKGFHEWNRNKNVFESDDATVILGVGKNMVHAIRYWLIASQILEVDENSLKPSEVGELIFNKKNGYDPYLEDDATIWLVHWLIASNASNATSFFWFFNHFHKPEFTQKELCDALHEFVSEQLGARTSTNTLKSDIALLLRMYEPTIDYRTTPIEEGLDSPLSMLGLINEISDTKYHESKLENRWNLPIAPFSYSVLEIFGATQISSLRVEQLMMSDGIHAAPGAVFRLNDEGLIAKLEEMIAWLPGYFELRETAGIHQLYKLKDIQFVDVLAKYYNENRNSRLGEVVA